VVIGQSIDTQTRSSHTAQSAFTARMKHAVERRVPARGRTTSMDESNSRAERRFIATARATVRSNALQADRDQHFELPSDRRQKWRWRTVRHRPRSKFSPLPGRVSRRPIAPRRSSPVGWPSADRIKSAVRHRHDCNTSSCPVFNRVPHRKVHHRRQSGECDRDWPSAASGDASCRQS